MKIKRLYLKNINSFYGEFEIDFTKFDRLFLISGPTGAGKSTIIDAILAALYNKTPRLKFSKYLLNKNAKSAKIVLEFEVDGVNYRINWDAKLIRKGKEIELKRTLYKENEQIADSKSVKDEILKLIKLDFNQFTKSVVLAQGEFDAFLRADSNEKMSVLERILDVREFEKISIKVFERTKALKEEAFYLQDKIAGILVCDKDIKALEKEVFCKFNELKEVNKELEIIEKNLFFLKEKKNLSSQKEKLFKEIESLKSEIKKIDYEKIKGEFFVKQKEFEKFKEEFLKNIKELDKEILIEKELNNFKERKDGKKDELNRLKKEILKEKKELESLKEKKSYVDSELKKIENSFFKDKALENFDEVNVIYNEIVFLRNEYMTSKELIKEYQDKSFFLEEEIEQLKKELETLKEEFEYLEAKALVLRYERERAVLKENMPCPLCGSLEHPFVKSPPNIEKDIKQKYEKLKGEIEYRENLLKNLEDELSKYKNFFEKEFKSLEDIKSKGEKLSKKLKTFGLSEDEIESLKKKKVKNEEFEKRKNELFNVLSGIVSKIEEKENFLNLKNRQKDKIIKEIKEYEDKISKIKLKYKSPSLKKELLQKEYNKKEEEFFDFKNSFFELEKRYVFLSSTIKEKENYLKEIEKKIKNIVVDEVDETEKEMLLEKKDSLNREIGYLKKEIEELKEELNLKKELQNKLKSLSKTLKIYEKLNSKIGSRDGKAFKKIAINYMIDSLLFMANKELEKLSDGRYILQKSKDLEKLDLFILDTFYSTQREVNTLSGGEKFLVSLALSFGLSNMLRDSIKIENMFLDEGFGSLDEESLNKALEVLLSSNRNIGIISHVEKLKDEIEQQIIIRKKTRGKSEIKVFY